MEKIRGVNLGNWLVLEKWMSPDVFEGTGADDEVWLNRLLPPRELADRLKAHRDTYITKEDFQYLALHGVRTVRIPVPYFIFGDRPPFGGCIEYLDMAFSWAEEYGMQILIDLHTVPGGQNGYDNGGLTGVCKWHKNPEEVEFVLTVLERLAKRYALREALFGIEVLNEPISLSVYLTAPSTGKAKDPEEAKGSGYVPMRFLREFYAEAYKRLRRILPTEKAIVFHDGFRLTRWKNFFKEYKMEHVYLDTHIYIYAMETVTHIAAPWLYKAYVRLSEYTIRRVQKKVPVLVGEWCISSRYADRLGKGAAEGSKEKEQQKECYRAIYEQQRKAWEKGAGWFYYNYQMLRDREAEPDESWKESWDLCRCFQNGWLPQNLEEDGQEADAGKDMQPEESRETASEKHEKQKERRETA